MNEGENCEKKRKRIAKDAAPVCWSFHQSRPVQGRSGIRRFRRWLIVLACAINRILLAPLSPRPFANLAAIDLAVTGSWHPARSKLTSQYIERWICIVFRFFFFSSFPSYSVFLQHFFFIFYFIFSLPLFLLFFFLNNKIDNRRVLNIDEWSNTILEIVVLFSYRERVLQWVATRIEIDTNFRCVIRGRLDKIPTLRGKSFYLNDRDESWK